MSEIFEVLLPGIPTYRSAYEPKSQPPQHKETLFPYEGRVFSFTYFHCQNYLTQVAMSGPDARRSLKSASVVVDLHVFPEIEEE